MLPCIGCSLPFDAGGCSHADSPPRVKPRLVGAVAELADAAHATQLHLALALGLLTWGAAGEADARRRTLGAGRWGATLGANG